VVKGLKKKRDHRIFDLSLTCYKNELKDVKFTLGFHSLEHDILSCDKTVCAVGQHHVYSHSVDTANNLDELACVPSLT